MEATNFHDVDRSANKLFLASPAGCELGTRSLLSRAALSSRVGVLARLLTPCAAVHLPADASGFELAHPAMEAEI